VPLYILSALAVVVGFANFPFGGDSIKLRFEHYVEPVAAYFPEIPHPEFTSWIAVVSTAAALLAIAVAYAYWFAGRFHGAADRSRVVRAGHTVLVNKYYLDHLYTGMVVGSIKGPIARGAYWFNQNVIDGVVNAAGIGSRKAGELLYRFVDQGVVDRAVNGAGIGAEDAGGFLRVIQSGRVQQYGALLFGGATVLAFALALFAV